jgi:SAM-dependent methyltransferase
MEHLRGDAAPDCTRRDTPGEESGDAAPEDYALLADLNLRLDRQGPGSDHATEKAIALAGLDRATSPKVADIGCGTGAATLLLARELDARVTAVDFLPEFIDKLRHRAHKSGVAGQVSPLVSDMAQLPFAPEEFDVIWSEGAVYNIGFAAGVTAWREFLRPGGSLVVSEITWTSATRPAEVQSFWESAYPEIDTAAAKIRVLEEAGYTPLGYFVLPPSCWLENYYLPLEREGAAFLERHGNSPQARALVQESERELALYRRFGDYYSYGMYIAQKR